MNTPSLQRQETKIEVMFHTSQNNTNKMIDIKNKYEEDIIEASNEDP
jgi:hypothetical protein